MFSILPFVELRIGDVSISLVGVSTLSLELNEPFLDLLGGAYDGDATSSSSPKKSLTFCNDTISSFDRVGVLALDDDGVKNDLLLLGVLEVDDDSDGCGGVRITRVDNNNPVSTFNDAGLNECLLLDNELTSSERPFLL